MQYQMLFGRRSLICEKAVAEPLPHRKVRDSRIGGQTRRIERLQLQLFQVGENGITEPVEIRETIENPDNNLCIDPLFVRNPNLFWLVGFVIPIRAHKPNLACWRQEVF
jgi:hypothetical protein